MRVVLTDGTSGALERVEENVLRISGNRCHWTIVRLDNTVNEMIMVSPGLVIKSAHSEHLDINLVFADPHGVRRAIGGAKSFHQDAPTWGRLSIISESTTVLDAVSVVAVWRHGDPPEEYRELSVPRLEDVRTREDFPNCLPLAPRLPLFWDGGPAHGSWSHGSLFDNFQGYGILDDTIPALSLDAYYNVDLSPIKCVPTTDLEEAAHISELLDIAHEFIRDDIFHCSNCRTIYSPEGELDTESLPICEVCGKIYVECALYEDEEHGIHGYPEEFDTAMYPPDIADIIEEAERIGRRIGFRPESATVDASREASNRKLRFAEEREI